MSDAGQVHPQHTEELLAALLDAEVEFVLIGGVAAIVHGASTATSDVDIAIPMSEPNIARLLVALAPYDPVHYSRPDIPLAHHTAAQLSEFRALLLQTRLGRLDVLAEVPPLGGAAELPRVLVPAFAERMIPVLSREALIAVKRHLGRAKDLLVVEELESLGT